MQELLLDEWLSDGGALYIGWRGQGGYTGERERHPAKSTMDRGES